MSDPVWPMETNDLPLLGSVMGVGEKLFRNTAPDSTGRYFATSWIAVILPLVPLGRYYVSRGETEASYTPVGSQVTTQYRFYGRSRLRPIEVIRTYLYCWGLAVSIFGPFLAWNLDLTDRDPSSIAPSSPLAFGAGALVLAVLLIGRATWSPVRRARIVSSRVISRRPRR